MSAATVDWESLRAARPVILAGFLPILLYRIWRVVRFPTSVPAIAATAFAVSAWIWILVFTDEVWSLLPWSVHAVSVGGWPAIMMSACLQVFVIGVAPDASPATIRRGVRTTFVVAVAVLIAVTVLIAHSEAPIGADDVYVAAAAFLAGSDPWTVAASVVTNAYVIFVVAQVAWVGFRNSDRTPIGVGLGLLATASVVQTIASLCGGIWSPLARGEGFMGSAFGRWLQTWPGSIAVILTLLGFLWPPVMSRVRARRELRRMRLLRDSLGAMFLGLFPPTESRMRLSDLAFEWMSHIQDGLTLLAQSRRVPLETDASVPTKKAERAGSVANWVVDQSVPGFSAEWLRPPPGTSDEDWVLAIADAYRDRQEGMAVPASSSGMPSTLRR